MRQLNTIQADIERSMEKAVLDCLVDNGYAPSRVNMSPNDYRLAIEAIKADKGFAVELYGNGAPEDRENLRVPRIVITGMGFSTGSAGTPFGESFEPNEDGLTYSKYKWGAPLSNYRVRVELWSNNVTQDRLIDSVRAASLPNLNFIQKYDDPETDYLLTYEFSVSIPQLSHGIIHKIYTYEVHDVVESLPYKSSTTIPKIAEIRVEETETKSNDLPDLGTGPLIFKVPPTPYDPLPGYPGGIFVSEDGEQIFVSESGDEIFTDESTPTPQQPDGFTTEDGANNIIGEGDQNNNPIIQE